MLISSSEVGQRAAQHENVVIAAKAAGVGLLAYTSALHADTARHGLAREHKATEDAIRAAGVPFVFLRNGWYFENYTEHLAQALKLGAFFGCAGEGRIAAASRADFAEAAVAVLTKTGHTNTIYELAGDAPFTMTELAEEVSRQAKQSVAYKNLPRTEYKSALLGAGLPEGFAELLVDSDEGIARGDFDDSSGDLRSLIGRPTTSLADAVAHALK